MIDAELERDALMLLEELLDVPEPQRDAWVAERTIGKPELAARLTGWRDAERHPELRTGAAIHAVHEPPPPDRIGAYRIVERIGRGGMGSVFRGERVTGDFAHVAAIKIIKPGLLSEALVERFQRERQTLAGLRHPNIAQLYDGGETADGSPYIIMEFVDGLPLLDWLKEQRPGRDERRRLFADICAAVAFANRNLVVHRDLTPSNVLVTQDGTVKLIDFGISRPIEEEAARADGPPIGSLSFTPGYAAPERMTGAHVTTAADIYSLGRLLQKLFPAVQDRELQAIVAKATATDPNDRYPTADALGADVDAWHRGFPVAAAGQTSLYAARKFAARNRLSVTAAAVGLVLLIGALIVTTLAYRHAEQARAAEQARFEELRSLANYNLFDLDRRLERVAGNTAARSDLAARAQAYLSALAASEGASSELRLEAARGFNRLGQIQGLPTEPNLGQRDEAKINLQKADAILNALPADLPGVALERARNRLFRSMIAVHGDGDQGASTALLDQAFADLDSVPDADRADDWHDLRAQALRGRFDLLLVSGELPQLAPLADRMATELELWPAEARQSREAEFQRAFIDYARGLALNNSGSPAQALPLLRASEERLERLDAASPNDPLVLNALAWTAYEGYGAGSEADRAESERFLLLARRTVDRLVSLESNDQSLRSFAVNIRQAQAEALGNRGDYSAAITLQREVIAGRTEAAARNPTANAHGRIGMAQLIMGNIALKGRDRSLACESYRASSRAFADARRTGGGELLGRYEAFERDVNANIGLCDTGRAPLPVT